MVGRRLLSVGESVKRRRDSDTAAEETGKKRRREQAEIAGSESKQQATAQPAGRPGPVHATEAERHSAVVSWIDKHAVKSTKKTYKPYLAQFEQYCKQSGAQQFPASEATVAAFLVDRFERKGGSASTYNSATAAIASAYRFSGVPSPTSGQLVKAVKTSIARQANPPKRKKALTLEHLQKIFADSDGSVLDTRDDFIIALMCATGMRESEAMALRMDGKQQDVWLEEVKVGTTTKEVLFNFVQKSKTDQERRGHTHVVGPAADPGVCPIRLFKRWMNERNSEAKYLFHARGSTEKLSAKVPNGRLKARLKRIGVDPRPFGSHSCRRTIATAAAKAGVEERVIKKYVNWRSDVVYTYIEESLERLLAVPAAVFGVR